MMFLPWPLHRSPGRVPPHAGYSRDAPGPVTLARGDVDHFRLASVSAVRPRLVELEHAVPGDRAGAAEVRWDARPQFRGDDLRQDQRIIAKDDAFTQDAARALGVAEGVGVVRLDEPDVLQCLRKCYWGLVRNKMPETF